MSDNTQNNSAVFWNEKSGEGPVAVSPKIQFGAMDHAVLELWKNKDVFQRTITERNGCPEFVAYDGPPGTNGEPHIGHMMQSALKDLWPRFFTMRGYRVLRKAGWDTHGLPVELTAEKELGLRSKRDIAQYGIDKYIDYCRSTVYRYKDAWTYAIKRIGRFLDTDNFYATYTKDYIQTDWWVLKQAWDKGLLYQGMKIMPYCARCGTSLSSHETAQGYRDITDISLYVKFRVAGKPNTYLVAWTTTAWTLLSNAALAVSPSLTYVSVQVSSGDVLVFAKARLEALKSYLGEFDIIDEKLGSEWAGTRYEPLWQFLTTDNPRAHTVFADDYVTAEDGSGIVHLALYGEDDFRIIRQNDLPIIQNVNQEGLCTPNAGIFAGRYFREEHLDVDILKDLASNGLLFGKEKIVHSYPHCYRCDSALMYFPKTGWFLRTSSYKEQMMEANSKINWYPDHIKEGRFGNWLANNIDWAISRERYWGSPLPIWTCKSCHHQICVGSLQELNDRLEKPLPENFDPHKPNIDQVIIKCPNCCGEMFRELEVLDSWFNAGIMPWGQWGYPEVPNSEQMVQQQYPADFICEAIDQTRGWFYSLLATSTLLTGQSSYKNVICTEFILDKDGFKMSKSRGNVVNPIAICEKYGADAVRWNFYRVNPWTVRRFNEDELAEVLKQLIIPYWNAYSFFVTYARVDGWQPNIDQPVSERLLDRWILSRLKYLTDTVENAMLNYDVTSAANAFTDFIDDLTNWFIRRSRRRFWKSEDDIDKRDAYATLYFVLTMTNRLFAPFLPFISETIYQNLERAYNPQAKDSVHLTEFPKIDDNLRNEALENDMAIARRVVTMIRSLRSDAAVRVRQPLYEAAVHGVEGGFTPEYEAIIMDELNIKRLRVVSDQKELFTYRARGDLKALGPKYGAQVKKVYDVITRLNDPQIRELLRDGKVEIAGYTIEASEVILDQIPQVKGWKVKVEGGVTAGVNCNLDDTLRAEWIAREVVHTIQNLRRDTDLQVTDRIRIKIVGESTLLDAIKTHYEYIATETLAVDIECLTELTENQRMISIGDCKGQINIAIS